MGFWTIRRRIASFSASIDVMADESSMNNKQTLLRVRTTRLGLDGCPSLGSLNRLSRDDADLISMSTVGGVADISFSGRWSWYISSSMTGGDDPGDVVVSNDLKVGSSISGGEDGMLDIAISISAVGMDER